MAKQTIAIGTTANDGTGSSLRAAFDICNDNFTEIYNAATPSGANVTLQGDVTVVGEISLADNKAVLLGSGGDAFLKHTGSGLSLFNDTGNIQITNRTDDGDIIFESDNGSGGTTEYLRLDGGDARTVASREIRTTDGVAFKAGNSGDIELYHSGTDSYLANNTGHIYIKNNADDKDIIFQSDDGSGSTENYIQIDGSEGRTTINKSLRINDSVELQIGSSADLKITHNGTNTEFNNYNGGVNFVQHQADGDIIFYADNGSGTATEYIRLDGGDRSIIVSAAMGMYFNDGVAARFGTGGDLILYHDGTDSYIQNTVSGDLIIENSVNDKDVIFKSDDGSGGTATYLFLDGSESRVTFNKYARFIDSVPLQLGTSGDFDMNHNGTDTSLTNYTGDLYITNQSDDKDIILRTDDGSGGFTTYLQLDGGSAIVQLHKDLYALDNVGIRAGNSGDLQIKHDSTHSYIQNYTGNLEITNNSDDNDIIFKSDDGSGGLAEYFKLDGSNVNVSISKQFNFVDSVVASFGNAADLQIFHNNTDSKIQNDTGDLYIINRTDDKDIIFQSDDGSGGVTEYFRLDGSTEANVFTKNVAIGSSSADGKLDITQSSTSDPVLRLTDDGVCNYDFIFPDSDTIKLETSTSSNKTFKLLNAGSGNMNLEVSGSLSKGSGSFKIDHPVKPDTHCLYHSFVESPLTDLIYRGKAKLTGGKTSVNIDEHFGMTDGTFVALVDDKQVFTTNEDGWDAVKGKIEGNELHIECQNENFEGYVSWLVIGDRKDAHIVAADWTDEKGKPILEVEK